MTTFHYDDTPLPVGVPVRMDGNDESYELGVYDGALQADQYADEPDQGILFESPEAARRWLDAATAVLTPYIENGDKNARVPDPAGWAVE